MRQSHWPLTALTCASALVSLALPIVTARMLDADSIGDFRIFFLYLMSVPSLALLTGMIHGYPFWTGAGTTGRERIRAATGLLAAGSALLTIGGLAALPWIGHLQPRWSSEIWLLFVASLLPGALAHYYEFAATSVGMIWRGAVFAAGFEITRTLALIAAAVVWKDLRVLLWIHVVLQYTKLAAALALGARDGFFPRARELGHAWRDVLRYVVPVSLSGAFDLFVTFSDRLMLSILISPKEFAVYSMGCLVVPPLMILEQSVNRILIPELSAAFTGRSTAAPKELFRKAAAELLLFSIPAAVGLAVFAEPIIELFFTGAYIEAAPFLRYYALIYVLIAIPFDAVQRARGNSRWILRTCIFFGTLSVVLAYVLVTTWGAPGALTSLLLLQTGRRAYGLLHVRSLEGWSLSSMLPWRRIATYTAASLALAVACIAARDSFASPVAWFASCAPVFAFVYLILLWPPLRSALWRVLPARRAGELAAGANQ